MALREGVDWKSDRAAKMWGPDASELEYMHEFYGPSPVTRPSRTLRKQYGPTPCCCISVWTVVPNPPRQLYASTLIMVSVCNALCCIHTRVYMPSTPLSFVHRQAGNLLGRSSIAIRAKLVRRPGCTKAEKSQRWHRRVPAGHCHFPRSPDVIHQLAFARHIGSEISATLLGDPATPDRQRAFVYPMPARRAMVAAKRC